MLTPDISRFLTGDLLYGDDFGPSEIAAWYADEKEGYANLGARDAASYEYAYHALNVHHGYRHLRETEFHHALGFGSAYGDELLPVIGRIRKITVVDPSDAFARSEVHGVPARYVKPSPDGTLPLESGTFALITCLGVLHHIPNVSFVVSEIARTLKRGGALLLREPIVSMGDWRKPRPGLTKRERGIPLQLLRAMFARAGLTVQHEGVCAFPVTSRLSRFFANGVYNSALATRLDSLMSRAFAWNLNYHPRTRFEYLRPASAYFVLRKP